MAYARNINFRNSLQWPMSSTQLIKPIYLLKYSPVMQQQHLFFKNLLNLPIINSYINVCTSCKFMVSFIYVTFFSSKAFICFLMSDNSSAMTNISFRTKSIYMIKANYCKNHIRKCNDSMLFCDKLLN